jgi:hypothetical protein
MEETMERRRRQRQRQGPDPVTAALRILLIVLTLIVAVAALIVAGRVLSHAAAPGAGRPTLDVASRGFDFSV